MPSKEELALLSGDEVVRRTELHRRAVGGPDEYARAVELEAAKIERAEPSVSTEEATRRAKAAVGHPDPFNIVGGVGRVDEGPISQSEADKQSTKRK
jgi:hypothetical protein